MKVVTLALLLIVISSHVNIAFSYDWVEDTEPAYRITLNDGSTLIGNIISEDDTAITFTTISGLEIVIELEKIDRVKPLSGEIREGRYIRYDPNSTRLLFAPTARPLKSGQGYVALYEFYLGFFGIGVGDIITLGGGFSIFPGLEEQIYYFAPKITPIQYENLDISAGVIHLGFTGDSDIGAGILYTAGTYGSRTTALTVGLGWGYLGEEVGDHPVVVLGGEVQLSNSIKLLTENWFPPGTDFSMVSLGIRFFGENLSTDLGFFVPTGIDGQGAIFFPWVNFVYNFGHN